MAGETAARLDVLDVFRGAAVAGMILVTSPGDWSHAYPLLRHAAWNGWTLADMVFPAFLFAVGMALALSFPRDLSAPGAYKRLWVRVARRAAALIGIGLLVNAIYTADVFGIPVIIGHPGLAFVRIPGVLQRIALCYAASIALIVAFPRRLPDGKVDVNARAIVIASVVILVGYWLLMRFVPVPGYGVGRLDQEGNLASYIDRAVFSAPHLWPLGSIKWAGPVVFDPEGLLSTFPATTNTLFGIIAGLAWRQSRQGAIHRLLIAGVAMVAAGLLLDPVFPINKQIWTSSFALLSGGFSVLALVFFGVVLRSPLLQRLCTPFRILGSNAVLGFILSIIFSKFADAPWFHLGGATVTAQGWGDAVARRILPDESLAATACALGVLAIITLMLWPLHRRAIRIRL